VRDTARVALATTVERDEIARRHYERSGVQRRSRDDAFSVPRHHPRVAATIRQRLEARPIVSKRLIIVRTIARFTQHG